MVVNDAIINKITNDIYKAYGSGYGVLFGIPAELRDGVKAVVKATLTHSGVVVFTKARDIPQSLRNKEVITNCGGEILMGEQERDWGELTKTEQEQFLNQWWKKLTFEQKCDVYWRD